MRVTGSPISSTIIWAAARLADGVKAFDSGPPRSRRLWTIVNFAILGCASGYTLAAAYALVAAPGVAAVFARTAMVLMLIALCTRTVSLMRNARIRPRSTLQTAIGIKHPNIVQKRRASGPLVCQSRIRVSGMTDAASRLEAAVAPDR